MEYYFQLIIETLFSFSNAEKLYIQLITVCLEISKLFSNSTIFLNYHLNIQLKLFQIANLLLNRKLLILQ